MSCWLAEPRRIDTAIGRLSELLAYSSYQHVAGQLTPSLCATISATLLSLSWFSQVAEPKRVTSSPICKPESAAGLPDTTVLTFANGIFAAA